MQRSKRRKLDEGANAFAEDVLNFYPQKLTEERFAKKINARDPGSKQNRIKSHRESERGSKNWILLLAFVLACMQKTGSLPIPHWD